MKKEPLDIYDDMPEDMINYLRYNGRHFNRKLCSFAVSQMVVHNPSTGEREKLVPISKETIDSLLNSYKIKLEDSDSLYDYVYVANMCKADFLGSSIIDEQHLCKYVKDVIDDVDGYDGIVFTRWYADMCRQGKPIDWYEMI
uniref:DUF7841 domain-containing protein n=1 Tax=Geladintestivirus 2 TaxID=3233134 RepID=A0AAU8MIN1_9CAUD